MRSDPLWQKILDDTAPGDPPFTTQAAVQRWGYSTPHTHSLLDYMANEKPPVMKKDVSVSPFQWRRV